MNKHKKQEENAGKLTEGKKIVDYVNARIRWLDGQWNAEDGTV